MITEEMLALAAGEVSAAMVACVEAVPHVFSRGFERKLHRLNRRAEHPVRYQVLRHVAAVLIAVITVFGALFAASPTVRAAVIGWVRSTFGSWIQYSTEETTPPDVQYDYCLPETFDGYTLLTTVDTEDGKLCMYANELGEMLRFQYIYGSTDLSLFIYDVENHNYIRSSVGDYPADIYITSDPGESNLIVWSNNAENVLFYVSAYADMNELLEIANSVKKR